MARSLDHKLAQHLLQEKPHRLKVPALPEDLASQLGELVDARRRPEVLGRLVQTLRPSQVDIAGFLGPHVAKAVSLGSTTPRGPPQLRGVEVAPLPGQGRSLLATRDLARGSICIQEQPIARVAMHGEEALGEETRLALQLWAADRAGLADLARDLLDHGGRDPQALRSRAVIAACSALCIPSLPASELGEAVEATFAWLGRVRINAVAVTTLAESESGELKSTKLALALYPNLARSVNHSCAPNAMLRFDKDTSAVEVVISSPTGVRAGEEVTISYGPTGASHRRSERQQKLQSQYGFDCLCAVCTASEQEDFQWKERAKKLDLRAQEAAGRGAWVEAATASAASLALLRQGYAAGDVEVAREECKLAGISLRAGKPDAARDLWSSAAEVLKPLACATDPDLVEAEEMLRRLPKKPEPTRPAEQAEQAPPPPPKTSPATKGFTAAGTRSDVAAALHRLKHAIDTANVSKDRVSSDATTVTDSFSGAIFGLESLSLSPAEKARVLSAMQGS
ncbi:SMYD4 [Symbiodinium natans]|uniref:SMYD4 protein n=1 Tax=Symbiodinium natans TaxID=878477 RepID=A0A812S5S1_9DINO|nr:SMYD4 [Symbiodinium natans]